MSAIKAMDQPDHLSKYLPYRHFSLCNIISIQNEIASYKFVKLNKCLAVNFYNLRARDT